MQGTTGTRTFLVAVAKSIITPQEISTSVDPKEPPLTFDYGEDGKIRKILKQGENSGRKRRKKIEEKEEEVEMLYSVSDIRVISNGNLSTYKRN